jgi:integrase
MPVPMGRDKGQGTIVPTKTPKGADRWRIAVTMADGRRVWRTARSPKEAERIRKQLVEARELDLDPTRQTLADWLRSWIAGLRDARNQRVRPRTIENYAMIVEQHIIPKLGGLKLAAVTGHRVQAWIDASEGAPRTVILNHTVLRRALSIAVRQRLLPYNPATAVDLPRPRTDTARPLTLEEAHALLVATRTDRLHALWRLALVTGLRQGELLGLAWDDIDGATITVRYQLQRIDRAWVRTAPKAARTLTRVALDAETVAVLDEHRLTMAEERTPEWAYFGHVFLTPAGRPYHRPAILREWHAACDAAGIPRRRFHDARHTAAHLLTDLGVDEKTRMARLGHTTVEMSRHYSGASEVQDRLAVERLGEALG